MYAIPICPSKRRFIRKTVDSYVEGGTLDDVLRNQQDYEYADLNQRIRHLLRREIAFVLLWETPGQLKKSRVTHFARIFGREIEIQVRDQNGGQDARSRCSDSDQIQSRPSSFEVDSMRTRKGSILALVATAALLISGAGAYAQPVTGWSPTPTLENLQTGLLEMISRLHLTHAQHEQVERIIANETMQLALTRGDHNLSVAGVFAQEHVIRIQARKQIASILTPRQTEKVAKQMIHDMEKRERWGEDPTAFFSIPATY